MQVAILAGGLATRLGDLTRHQPKSMVKVQGKPFLEYQLEFLREGGVRNYDSYDRSNTTIEGNLVRKYSKNDKSKDMFYIDYGVSIFRKEALELISKRRPYPLEDYFVTLIGKKELLAFEVKERFYEIGSPEGLRDFKNYMAKNKK